jgi:hypothetical protein
MMLFEVERKVKATAILLFVGRDVISGEGS